MIPAPARTRLTAALVAIGLLLLAAAAGHVIANLSIAAPESADVALELPGQAGDWTGEAVLYCQNERCLRSFRTSELGTATTCPVCGGLLDPVSLGEHNILPPDTLIARKLYTNRRGEQVNATVVVSRSEQKSIHRPEQCLPAQGLAIESSRVLTVPLPGRAPLNLSLLRAVRHGRQAGGAGIAFAYCFAGGGRETASHYRRLAWMAWDNLVHGYRARWAYVSVQTADPGNRRATEARLADFISAVYPLVHRR